MILCLLEHDRGQAVEASFEALTLARRLAQREGTPLHAVMAGEDAPVITERLAAHGVSTLHRVRHEALSDYAPSAWAQGVVEVMRSADALAVLAAGTDRGNEVLAHAAARTDLPMAANCVEVEPGDPWVVTRQRWGGSVLEDARLRGRPRLLTVAPHAVAAETAPAPTGISVREVRPTLSAGDLRVRVTARADAAPGRISLAEARVVVGGGRGVGGADGFRMLEELAGLLGGVVGCSRVVTSQGWRPHTDQVGQTGTRIAPELYLACGISGAIQHMVGCKAARRILAINSDAEAPILESAHYAVIGDLHRVLPAVIQEIRRRGGGRPA